MLRHPCSRDLPTCRGGYRSRTSGAAENIADACRSARSRERSGDPLPLSFFQSCSYKGDSFFRIRVQRETASSWPFRPQGFGGRARLQQFRRAHRPGGVAQGRPQGARSRHHAVRHRGRLRQPRRLRRDPRRDASATAARTSCWRPSSAMPMDEAGTLQGRLAPLHHARRRGEPEAARAPTGSISTSSTRPDPLTPIEETLRALDDLVRAGQGALHRLLEPAGLAGGRGAVDGDAPSGCTHFVSCQDEYSLLVRDIEKELIPAMQAYGLGLLPYFPLASGLLTGKYKRDAPPPEGTRLATTPAPRRPLADGARTGRASSGSTDFAPTRGHTMLELAFSWLRGEADGRQRHRRRHQARAGRAERQGHRLEAHARGHRRDRHAEREGTGQGGLSPTD